MQRQSIALMLTDTHLHDGNIELVKDIFNQAIEVCKKYDIKEMYHLGDWFTSRKAQSQHVLLATQDIIYKILSEYINVSVIKGNHDAVEADSENSFLDIFHTYTERGSFDIIRRETSIPLHKFNLTIDLIPYFKETGSYLQRVENIKNKYVQETNILLTHIALQGAVNNDGSVVENGLSNEVFSKYKYVYSGHYHERNGSYIGSAYQANYGENNQKGFSILYSDGSHEFVKSKFPEYIKVKLDINDEKAIKAAQKQYKDSSDHVRFEFIGNEADLKTVSKEKYSALGIDITFKKDEAIPLEVGDLIEKAKGVSFDRNNIVNAFDLFCKTNHIEDNSVGKNYLDKI